MRSGVLHICYLWTFDYENYLEFKYKFSDKLSLTNLIDYNNFRGIEFYKMKIGVEYEL